MRRKHLSGRASGSTPKILILKRRRIIIMETFLGYERPDGSIGIRNYVAILPAVACANGVVAAIARSVPEAVPLYHGHGCGRGVEIPMHTRTLVNLGKHPNVAAVLVVGLGCEVIKAEALATAIATTSKPVEYFNIQETGGTRKSTARGVEIVQRMLSSAGMIERKSFPLGPDHHGARVRRFRCLFGRYCQPKCRPGIGLDGGPGGNGYSHRGYGDDRHEPYPGASGLRSRSSGQDYQDGGRCRATYP